MTYERIRPIRICPGCQISWPYHWRQSQDWVCKKCRMRKYAADLRAAKRAAYCGPPKKVKFLSGPCSPETAARISSLLKADSAALSRLLILMGVKP